MTPERYRDAYLEPLRDAARRECEPAALPARAYYRPEGRGPRERSCSELFEAGVLGGHGESRAALAARLRELDAHAARIRSLEDLLARRERDFAEAASTHAAHARQLDKAVEDARARVRTLEESTSWRMTAPLRYTIHRAKLAARTARSLGHSAQLVPARLATARQILKHGGAKELGRRLRAKLLARKAFPPGLRPRGALEPAIAPLEVPASATPRVSVVIPAYGQDLHTFTCLKAVAREAERVPLEVIVMDDCAPVAAAEALAAVKGVRFVRNDANLGFLRNANRGAGLARGEYLLFLNNDAVLQPGALEALLRVFESHPDAGVAGAKLVFPDGSLQEAGGIVWRDGSAWNYGRGDDPAKPEYNYLRDADYCSGACLLVPRLLFEELGRFDEAYAPAYCEDLDFCFKVRAAGRRVLYQPAAEAVHHEGASHGTNEAEGTKRYQVVNREKVFRRWHAALADHRVNGMSPRLERDRAARLRVLVVEACMLTPDQDSGSVRTWRTLQVMRSMGCKVTLVADNLEYLEPWVPRLREEGVEVLHHPFTASIEGHLEEHGPEYDVVILARYYVALRHIDAVRRHAPRALLVLDTVDLHFLRSRRLAELERSRALVQGAAAVYEQEMDCIRRSDVTWVVSPVEREVLAREVPQARVIVHTNVHDPAAAVRPFGEREGIVFVGGYRHPPNVDAALFYAREVAPRLRERLPGVTSYLIGSNAPQSLLALRGEGIEVVGFVPDIEPWFDRCRVSVSPLRYGAGVKGKVNHSMSRGAPVVATTVSIEGMHLVPGEEILVADDPDAFAEAIAKLYRDESLWNRLSSAGLENIRRHFSREVARRCLEETFALRPSLRPAQDAASPE